MNKNERRANILMLVISVATIYYSLTKLKLGTIGEPGPGFFPFVCGTGILILCLLWFVINPKVDTSAPVLWEKGNWIAPVIAMVLITLYTFGLETLGYCASTFIFLIAWEIAVAREKWLRTGIIAVIGTVAMYVLFGSLLGVPLPQGLLI